MKKKMAVFDMDGTLFDTCESNYRAYEFAIKESGFDKTISLGDFQKKCFGKNYKDFLPEIYGIADAEAIKIIHDIKKKTYKSVLEKHGKTFDGLLDLLKCIKSEYVIVLWTTASKENTYELLDVFQCTNLFDEIITAEDVKVLKPDLEGLNKVMDKYGIAKEKIVYFDDSEASVQKASEQGITSFRVLN